MMNLDSVSLPLPKWPQMIVTGEPVTADQAKEIIRRTDMFFCGYTGNDREWNQKLHKRLGMYFELDRFGPSDDLKGRWEDQVRWREAWGLLSLEYVRTSWLSSAFIFGPHGWCRPDGTIFSAHNVGKWPSAQEIMDDWALLAKTFPVLDLAVTLMSDEEVTPNTTPVVSFLVKHGEVTAHEGNADYHKNHKQVESKTIEQGVDELINKPMNEREHGPIPASWYDEWAALAQSLGLTKET